MLLMFALVQHLAKETGLKCFVDDIPGIFLQNFTGRIGKLDIEIDFFARCCSIFWAENILKETLFV